VTVGKKLSLSFGGLLALTLVLSVVSLVVIRNLSGELDRMALSTNRAVAEIGRLTTSLAKLQGAEAEFILRYSIGDMEGVAKERASFERSSADLRQRFGNLEKLLVDQQSRAALTKIESGVHELQQLFGQMDSVCQAGRCNEALDLHSNQSSKTAESLNETAASLTALQERSSAEAATTAGSTATASQWAMALLAAFSLLLAGPVFYILRDVLQRFARFAEQIGSTAHQVSEAAARVTTTSQQLARGASEQAASIEETSATTEEIASMTRKNAENTNLAVKFVKESDRNVTEANQRLVEMVNSMEAINESSNKISRINKAIDEIAFQTNILALNAAVEAARAGNAGLGFAVVADEVRGLAQRCLQASKDTGGLIEESMMRAEEGKRKLEDVTTTIHQITQSSQKVRELIEEVSTGSHEQAQGIEQVTHTVSNMNEVTQRSAGSAEETASAGTELQASADDMKSLGDELALMIHGGSGLR
jgi:methyl-accepting chemotaxis protein/methyl-accepting chemotaxis protein-1 (serine sensor receptor)